MRYVIIDQKKSRQVKKFNSYAEAQEACKFLNDATRDTVEAGRYPRFTIGQVAE